MFNSLKTIKEVRGSTKKVKFMVAYFLYVFSSKKLNFFPEVIINCGRYKFKCRPKTSDYWHVSTQYEKETTAYLKNIKDKKGIFIDVGAHIGRFSILLSNNFEQVISVEPTTTNYKALEENIKLNKLKNINPINCALSDFVGDSYIYLNKTNSGQNSLVEKTNKKERVKVQTLDAVLKEQKINKPIKLIKIDVEGAEAEVLKGATKTLQKHHPKIVFEAWDNEKLRGIKEVLKPFGYKIKKIGEENYLSH